MLLPMGNQEKVGYVWGHKMEGLCWALFDKVVGQGTCVVKLWREKRQEEGSLTWDKNANNAVGQGTCVIELWREKKEEEGCVG